MTPPVTYGRLQVTTRHIGLVRATVHSGGGEERDSRRWVMEEGKGGLCNWELMEGGDEGR